MKEEQIEIEKDLKKLRESLQICKQELSKRQNELSQANQEEMDKKKEKTKILEKNKSEEDDLKKKLELAKKKLRSHHGEKDRYVCICTCMPTFFNEHRIKICARYYN